MRVTMALTCPTIDKNTEVILVFKTNDLYTCAVFPLFLFAHILSKEISDDLIIVGTAETAGWICNHFKQLTFTEPILLTQRDFSAGLSNQLNFNADEMVTATTTGALGLFQVTLDTYSYSGVNNLIFELLLYQKYSQTSAVIAVGLTRMVDLNEQSYITPVG